MTEIPEVYGVWPEPPACCGDPGDCDEPCEQPRLVRADGGPVDPRAELLFQTAIEEGLLERAGEAVSRITYWTGITGEPAPPLTREVFDRSMEQALKRGQEIDLRPHHPRCPVLRKPVTGPPPHPGDGLCTCGAWPR